jgi:hypothetical protein
MNRRDAVKALATLASTTGMTVTPVRTRDVQGIVGVLIHVKGKLSAASAKQVGQIWTDAWRGTALEGVRTVVLDDDTEVEFVRAPHA